MGLSAFQPGRGLIDWPDDVVELAATLRLDRFAVLGISGGGPYAAVCAWKLADRLTGAGIVSSLAPFNVPGAVASMDRRNRLAFQLARHLGVVRRILMAQVARSVSRRQERTLESGVATAVDKEYLDRPEVRRILGESLSEAFRDGSRGPAWEMGLYTLPWEFRLEEIRTPVHLGTGSRTPTLRSPWDAIWRRAFPSVARPSIPGEGHLHFVDRLPEILARHLSVRSSERNTQIELSRPLARRAQTSGSVNRLVRSGVVRGKPFAKHAHECERRIGSLAQDRFEGRLTDLEDTDVGLRAQRRDARAAGDDRHLSNDVAAAANCQRSAVSDHIDISVDNDEGRLAGLSLRSDELSFGKHMLLCDLGNRQQVLWCEGSEERRLAQEDDTLDEWDGGLCTRHGYSFQRFTRELRASANPLIVVAS